MGKITTTIQADPRGLLDELVERIKTETLVRDATTRVRDRAERTGRIDGLTTAVELLDATIRSTEEGKPVERRDYADIIEGER